MPRRGRHLALAIGALGLAAVLAAAAASRRALERRSAERARPTLDGVLALPGLERRAEIVRDSRGIPHVRAASERDALFALGFVHAQDRLAEMEWLRRTAAGRVAEALGPEALPADRMARALGIARHARARAEGLDAETRRALDSYAAGVNAHLARVANGSAALPLALARLGLVPEPWSPADSIAVVKALAWALDGSLDATLVLSDLIERLGGFGARPFFPPGAEAELLPVVEPPPVQARGGPALRVACGDPLRAALGLSGRSIGSSGWLIAGAAAQGQRPLLAGDLHLEPTVPALLYEAHWSSPGVEVIGATIPGAPVFWSGHNGRVAWLATHARVAAVDVYTENVRGAEPGRYRHRSRWHDLAVREEEIGVRGAPDERLLVRETVHGPLVESLLGAERPALAVAWPGAQPGDGIGALLRAARSRDGAGFRTALAEHHEPALLFLYADTGGAGGLQLAGWLPQRAIATGLVPVPGRSGWYDWRGRVPFEALPRASLGDGGEWLVAADDPPVAARGADSVEWWWRSGERARRIESLLAESRARGPIGSADLVAIQNDVVAADGPRRARALLDLAGDPAELPAEGRAVVEILAAWDGSTAPESVGATAWHELVRVLLGSVLAERVGEELLGRYLRLRGVAPEELLERLVGAALAPSPDPDAPVGADALREGVRAALRRTGLALRVRLGPDRGDWSWGRVHALRFRPLGWAAEAWDESELPASLPYGGDGATISAGEYDADRPYEVRVISAYRLILDLATPALGLSSLAPGATEHVRDPLASVGLARWVEGRPGLLTTHPLVVEETALARLVLEPEARP